MKFIGSVFRLVSLALVAVLVSIALSGCATVEQNIALGVVGGTAYFGRTPGSEIEQIYYLGVFDPQEQVAPTIYRVRVHGQASALSRTKFASGWVKSELIDSLATNIDFSGAKGKINVESAGGEQLQFLNADRRLILFGPEGFREVPKNHRLVIVMGSSPEAFFQAIDKALGVISDVKVQAADEGMTRKFLEALYKMESEQEQLDNLNKDIIADLAKTSGRKEGNQ